jgi:hypothetical protein
MSAYCVNKLSKNNYALVDCNKSKYIFLGVYGPDKKLKKDQLTYKIIIKDTSILLSKAQGCSQKTLHIGKQQVMYCALIYKDKSVISVFKDGLQARIKKIFFKITGREYIDKNDLKATNFQKEKNLLGEKSYIAAASYKGYKPVISGGALGFSYSKDKIGTVLDIARKRDCEIGGGKYSHSSCSKAPFSYTDSKMVSSSWDVNSNSNSHSYDDPSNIVLQAVMNTLSH